MRAVAVFVLVAACDPLAAPVSVTEGALGEPIETCPLDDIDRGVLPPLPIETLPPPRAPRAACGADGCLYDRSDDIYGTLVPRAEAWWVDDGFIYSGSRRVKLHGVSWFGLEGKDVALHGLWTGRSIKSFLDQMVDLGFNALRLPLSPESYRPGYTLPGWAQQGGMTTARDMLLAVLDETGKRNITVLLDHHTCAHDAEPPPGTPDGCPGYTKADWFDDLRLLADLAAAHPNVIGIDILNEPYDLLWGEWADLASEAAKVVLVQNPNILVFVQGASYLSAGAAYDVIHGESLTHAEVYPPDIPASRLVYAPHAYGPDVFALNYLTSDQYPQVLSQVWELRFGHLFTSGHGFVVGEFGGHYDDAIVPGSVDWQDRFVAWMRLRGIDSFFYWCWNPNSGNTGGILEDDWKTPNAAKMRLLAPLLAD